VIGAVGEGEVPRQHRQQNRQREVVVLDRALLRLDPRSRVRLATGLLRADELALRRDDVEEDVCGHHRPDHRPDLEPRGPGAEELGRPPRGERDEQEEHRPQHAWVGDEPVEDVVDDPSCGKEPDRNGDGDPRVEVVARLDERARGLEVVQDEHQAEAREPGRVRLPLEPGEVLGEHARRDDVLLHLVEAAAVHLPELAPDAGLGVRRVLRRPERLIEQDEVEGRPDPRHRRDHVQPSQAQVEPVADRVGEG